jgi:hypothetical protein
VDFTMTALDVYFAPLAWTGRMLSRTIYNFFCMLLTTLMCIRTKEQLQSGEMLIPGNQWPVFLYASYRFDAEDPWSGLLRSSILVAVRFLVLIWVIRLTDTLPSSEAYKHVFTSPSLVDKVVKATRSCNARIHGMTSVTPASIAYIATQVRPYLLSPVQF